MGGERRKAEKARLLEHPYYETRLRWVTGTVFDVTHLMDWAKGGRARAFVVLGDDAVCRGVEVLDGRQRASSAGVERGTMLPRRA